MTVLTWTCEACNQPIEGDTGRLHVQEWRTAERSDDPDYWHVHHGTCIPADHLTEDGAYVSGYCIDTGQVATRSQLARWTRHLAAKNWSSAPQVSTSLATPGANSCTRWTATARTRTSPPALPPQTPADTAPACSVGSCRRTPSTHRHGPHTESDATGGRPAPSGV